MTRKLNVVDIFAGTGSSVEAFYKAGHNVVFVEYDGALCAELRTNYPNALVLEMDAKAFAKDPWRYLPASWREQGIDVLWMSPPCTAFSMAGSGSKKRGSRRWAYNGPYKFFGPRFPKDQTARLGCGLVLAALAIERKLKPRYWWMENPMGGLMTMGFLPHKPTIVTYCQYGGTGGTLNMKPTTLWGKWPASWRPRARCKNGDPCHERAPRGSRTGTQGLKDAKERARIPFALSEEIARACEIDIA